MNKLVTTLALLTFGTLASFGRDTAYQALRTLAKEKGKSVLDHVIQVEGHGGAPQPSIWKVLIDDPGARSGVREFEIANGRIISERTPVRTYAGSGEHALMDFGKLNLDSTGAFTVVEQEAGKSRIGFDKVDYLLRRDDRGTTPIWVLRLMDSNRTNVATLHVAADSGVITLRRGLNNDRGPDRAYADDQPIERPDDREEGSGRDLHVGHEIDKALHRVGGSLQEFFTGRRTVDRRFRDEP